MDKAAKDELDGGSETGGAEQAASGGLPAKPPPPPAEPAAAVSQRVLSEGEKDLIKEEAENAPHHVVLRVQVASKLQARILTWTVIVLNIIFVALAVTVLAAQGLFKTLGDLRPLFKTQLALGSVCLGSVTVVLLWTFTSSRANAKVGRTWTKRQKYFRAVAIVLLLSTLVFAVCFVTGVASTLARDDCSFNWLLLAGLEFVRKLAFAFVLVFLLISLANMTLWRGPGALDLKPDSRLTVDQPWTAAVWTKPYLFGFALFAFTLGFLCANLAGRIHQYDIGARSAIKGCSLSLENAKCKASALQMSASVLVFVITLLFVVVYTLLLRRAMQDHKALPFCRFRSTSIFVRVQARVILPVQLAMLIASLILEMIPALRGSCSSAITSQMGNLSVLLSLTVASLVMGTLYMPKAQEMDSPLLQEFLQEFSWTEAGLPEAFERRKQHLLASEAAYKHTGDAPDLAAGLANTVAGAVDFVPGLMRGAVGMMAGSQGLGDAVEQLSKEPMFCMETAIRLFYWSRLAYRNDEQLDYEFVNAKAAMGLFDLEHWEKIEDLETDTHSVIGWSGTRAVLAFRGTASAENAITDLKSWRVSYAPEPVWNGRRIGTHAGFLKAWTTNGFNDRVLGRLREIDSERPEGSAPLRIWVTGHSLGGALAVLASQQLSRAFPDSRMTLYTFGCPRVGNSAFAAMFNAAIPDAWALINHGDPVTIIPKIGFKRIGQRVNVDISGNCIVRGSYFELSVVHRGTLVANHKMGQYGLALAVILKSQFSASKCMPGGAEGAKALLGSLDVGQTLVVTNLDAENIRDPAKLPVMTEMLQSQLARGKESSKSLMNCCGRV